MAFTDQIGQASSTHPAKLSNIQLGIGAVTNPSVNAPLFTGVLQSRWATVTKVVQRGTTQLDTIPGSFDMATTETFPYIVDVTNYLGTGDSVNSVVAALRLLSTNQTIPNSGATVWQGTISISGNIITIPINVGVLRYGQRYKILVTFQGSSSKTATYSSTFRVVFGSGGVTDPSQLDTLPAMFVVGSTETAWPYVVDATNYLLGSDTVSSASVNLYFATATIVPSSWIISTTIAGNIITTVGNISKLALGQTYYLITTFTANTNKVVSFISAVKVVAG